MRSMIYYPGFEIENEKWLKFALLYFDELRPIIPYMNIQENKYLSENSIQIMNETDLIRPYTPEFEEGHCASILACAEFDKYLEYPKRYSYAFGRSSNENIIDRWKNVAFQTCNLYNGKFSQEFYQYCLDNGLAQPFDDGIRMSKDLAFVYMSFLADIISKNKEIEMFTDISHYNNLLLINDKYLTASQNERYKIAKTQIEFAIPGKITQISLENIINLRNNRDFSSCRKAYIKEIENYLERREIEPDISFDEQISAKKDLIRIIEMIMGTTASLYLTCSAVSSMISGSISPFQALAAAYSDLTAAKNITELPEFIRNISDKVQAKRYIGYLRKAYNKSMII